MKITILSKTFFVALAVATELIVFRGASAAAPMPSNVVVDSLRIKQSDTFLVKVLNESGEVSGKFGAQKLSFFRSQDGKDWVSIVGVNVKKQPGTYWLVVDISGQNRWRKIITVSARKFPVAPLQFTQSQVQQGFTAKKLLKTIASDSNLSLSAAIASVTPLAYFQKPFVYPLSTIKVTGNYGDIRKSGKYKIQHLGVDLEANVGTPVYAVNDGKVVLAASLAEYGNTLVIDHGFGIYSLYLHLSSFKAAVGDMVHQGDVVALSGNTGYVLGPHLHFSMKVGKASVDPLAFIKATGSGW